ncbi:unnamed protein product [Protopolystoma xenopodis]|uniref:Uncharacterized protein n=1 Tax=Protopolystoma xenopodis TaxID=117903 RepID=A0A3S5ALY7_9PLAT|nr:unnamed protein product [Protopolystoma xenopodis]
MLICTCISRFYPLKQRPARRQHLFLPLSLSLPLLELRVSLGTSQPHDLGVLQFFWFGGLLEALNKSRGLQDSLIMHHWLPTSSLKCAFCRLAFAFLPTGEAGRMQQTLKAAKKTTVLSSTARNHAYPLFTSHNSTTSHLVQPPPGRNAANGHFSQHETRVLFHSHSFSCFQPPPTLKARSV